MPFASHLLLSVLAHGDQGSTDEVILLVGTEGDMNEIRLKPGESYRIRPGTRHRMSAEIPCVLVEVSSPELDDVVRLEDAYGRAGTTEP